MLDDEKAKAAARAVLDQPQREQQERAARLAAGKRRRFPPIKWLAIGGLSGLGLGAVLGFFITGETTPWSILGLATGMAVGMGFDRRHGP